jgi:Cdc6-like AAA superfamily ATPase
MVEYWEMSRAIPTTLSYEDANTLSVRAGKVFQPRTPVTTRELFAGRWNQLTTVTDAVSQPGLHVVIYGERGVGKSSLANVVRPVIRAFDNAGKDSASVEERLVVKANANSGDTFSVIWNRLLSELTWEGNRPIIGFQPSPRQRVSLQEAFGLPDLLSVDDVRRTLSVLVGSVFIVDEFDRAALETSRTFTDLIKVLSDLAVDCTIILVGVSATVDQLVADHASINRSVVQIMLPRMEAKELREILSNAEKLLGIEFSQEAADLIIHVSQGLPHYTHLVGLNSVRKAAVGRWSRHIERADVFEALKEAVKQAQQTVTEKYVKATHSAHKDALYRHVLLACAISAARSHDALGYFNPGSMVEPLEGILGRIVQIATFSNHLSEFCQPKRGDVLERVGQERAFRFRFHDPLLVPFVFMETLSTGLITAEQLTLLLGGTF